MPSPRRVAAWALAALALPGAAALAAAPPLPPPRSPALWATIDVCEPPGHPDTVGVRGSMPGTGDGAEMMYMQFRLEYRRGHLWTDVGAGALSSFERVGNAAARARQAGIDFVLAPGARGHSLVRGVITFEWRAGAAVVATTIRSTSGGHHAGAGADPPGYSASDCRIAANRRGSLVMTPVTPSAASRAIVAASSTVQA